MKSSMDVLLDSSVWIALFLDADTQHDRAARFFASLSSKIYVSDLVLNEVATVLTYKHSKAQADKFLEFLEANKDIVWLESARTEDTEFFRNIPNRISFTDTVLLRLSKVFKIKLVTYDTQLARLCRQQNRSNKKCITSCQK